MHHGEHTLRNLRLSFAGIALALTAGTYADALFPGDTGASFSTEQVKRGQDAYARSCLSCHGPALEGTQFAPPLQGAAFEGHWRGRPRAAFSTQIRSTMPPGGVGSLGGQAYTDIESYILQANAAAPGGQPPAPGGPPTTTAATRAQAQSAPREPPMIAPVPKHDNDPQYLAAMKAREQKLAGVTSVTDTMLAHPAQSDWLVWRRTYDAQGYSPLRQINRSNVGRLRVAWSWALPQSSNEITPLIHDGVLFVYSGPVVQALDAASGELLWQYLRALPDEFDNGRRAHAKSLAIYGEKLFAPTADGHIVALDVRTGHLIWDQEVVAKTARPWRSDSGRVSGRQAATTPRSTSFISASVTPTIRRRCWRPDRVRPA